MQRPSGLRAPLLALAIAGLVGAVAAPTFAADPSAAPGAQASEKPGKGPKASHEPEVTVTLRGTVAVATDAEGNATYTITANGKTVHLGAGPVWFFGDDHPLAGFVGKTVTIVGGQHGDEVDVATVDGKALREPGKPAWAGGWKAVGATHPGWSQEKADRWAKRLAAWAESGARGAAGIAAKAGCWPPGHCKGPKANASGDPGNVEPRP